MEKQKELAIPDYMNMIKKSWTWARLTEDEKSAFCEVTRNASEYTLKGTYRQRWEQLCWLYDAFLAGCGYRNGHFREGGRMSDCTGECDGCRHKKRIPGDIDRIDREPRYFCDYEEGRI